MGTVERDGLRNVHICDSIAVGKAKGFRASQVIFYCLESSTGTGFVASIDKGHMPWFGVVSVNLDAVFRHMKSGVSCVKEIIREKLFDYVALVTKANDEIIDAV